MVSPSPHLTFEIVLAPNGVSVDDASDTRRFIVTFDETPTDNRQAAVDHIRDEELIDPVTFRKYWDVAAVVPITTEPLAGLKEAILDLDDETREELADQARTPVTRQVYHIYRPGTDTWEISRLVVPKTTLDTWLIAYRRLCNQHSIIDTADTRIIHEAILRTVVDCASSPDAATIRDELDTMPGVHHHFFQTAIDHSDRVVEYVRRLST